MFRKTRIVFILFLLAVNYEDYTTGERLGLGALNIFFGLGSIVNAQELGWGVTVVEGVGVAVLTAGLLTNPDSALYGSEYAK
jgi:hypothetical protein